MAFEVKWSRHALADVKNTVNYISQDSIQYANQFKMQVAQLADGLTSMPERGRVVPELANSNVRELIAGNYRLIYLVGDGRVIILSIVHGARKFNPTEASERTDKADL